MSAVANPFAGLPVANAPKVSPYKISDKQVALIRKLVAEKDVSALLSERELDNFDVFLRTLTGGWGGTGSQLIDALFNAPRKAVKVELAEGEEATTVTSPAGYYGVDGKRYRIDRPTKGNWAGWTFFKTGSDYYEQKKLGSVPPGGAYRGKAADTFAAIQADPQAAAVEYARITSRCGICNRKLEDDESVARGIGPICAENVGW